MKMIIVLYLRIKNAYFAAQFLDFIFWPKKKFIMSSSSKPVGATSIFLVKFIVAILLFIALVTMIVSQNMEALPVVQ